MTTPFSQAMDVPEPLNVVPNDMEMTPVTPEVDLQVALMVSRGGCWVRRLAGMILSLIDDLYLPSASGADL